jgi:peptidoglycan/xylan/chitin deacetylase (PgdA/CDA1 family)
MIITVLVVLLIVAAAEGVFVFACYSPSSNFFKPVLIQGPPEARKVALTFDDGPAPPFTEKILDILKEKNVTATFFVCGRNAERYPETVRRIVRDGHTLGNHTYSHLSLFMRGTRRMADEIDRAQEAIEIVSGIRPAIFRPPYGARFPGLMGVLAERGLKLVMWSASGRDWRLPTEGIVESVLRKLKPGAVILLHDGQGIDEPARVDRSKTVEALPEIIDRTRKAGFEFASLSEFSV